MAPRRVAVAASGGRDSTALLHCTARQAQALGLEVVALHVHHGLVAQADDWLTQLRNQSRRWGVGFRFQRLPTKPEAGASVEAWARRERYVALAEMAHDTGCDLVLLAHHRRDQAETWLLQALRGATAAGLAAMPRHAQRQGLTWSRPWLDKPRTAIEAYVRRHRLQFVDDASNADPRFARNRLRLQVWPALSQAFVDAEQVLVAAAQHAQTAQALAREVAAADLQTVRGSGVDVGPAAGLNLDTWWQLTPARRANALRFWLQQVLGQGAPDSLLLRLLSELPGAGSCGQASSATWPAPVGSLAVYRGVLQWLPAAPATARAQDDAEPQWLDLSQPGVYEVPSWSGRWEVVAVKLGGLPEAKLQNVHLLPRSGGERWAAAPAATPRSLKKQYQSAGVPEWLRNGPLLWAADRRLLWVPGLGPDARYLAQPGQPQRALRWLPDQAHPKR